MSSASSEAHYLGKYELQQRLAHGGQGDVWKALDTELKRYVAIKILHADLRHDPDFVMRFQREAQLIAALHHPNIVQIHNLAVVPSPDGVDTIAYMVMDFVEGQTLADYIRNTSRKRQFPSAADLIYLFTGISLAIDYAHSKGMIHRDIKPANILLDQRLPTPRPMGQPILTDFGIARMQGVASGTVVGSLLGTPLYISPEQAKGLHGDERSDLYSLGIILYEMTTGVTPFRGETTMNILMQHLHDMPKPPSLFNSDISPALSAVILKSIAKEPVDRFPSASAMTIALAETLNMPVPAQLQASASSSYLASTAGTPAPTATPATTPAYNPLSPSPPRTVSNTPEMGPGAASYAPVPPTAPFTPTRQAAMEPATAQPGVPTPQRPPRGRGRIALFATLAALVLLGIGLGIYTLLSQPTPQLTSLVVGQVRFTRSAHAAAGNYDQVQIDLHNVPPPQPGHVYYAWLETAGTESDRPHWRLSVASDGTIHAANLTYRGFANLLSPNMILLITEEKANTTPFSPYPQPGARHYYAQIAPLSATVFTIKSCPKSSANNICMQY
jgi:serine/threonine protein kinase